jgi:hypothetical protein
MFNPTLPITIEVASGETDVFGQPTAARVVQERCSVVSLTRRSAKTSIRADSSATRGNATEIEADGTLLLSPTTAAGIDDVATVAGQRVRLVAITQQFDLNGRLDHHEVMVVHWSEQ